MTAADRPEWPRGGFGVVGLGVTGEPSTHFTRPDRCSDHGHPGVTYNPWLDQTVCLCGGRWMPGNQHTNAARTGGPLVSDVPRPADWERPVGAWCAVVVREPRQLDLFQEAV